MAKASTLQKQAAILNSSTLDTPLGTMIAIANEQALYLLEFVDGRRVEREIERLREKTESSIVRGTTPPLNSIAMELTQYFEGTLKEFKTPLLFFGSVFQKQVWHALKEIPAGQTRAYSALAAAIGKPSAARAVAQANGANQLAIIIPCHRVINANGNLGGYGGKPERKEWLIAHEKRFA